MTQPTTAELIQKRIDQWNEEIVNGNWSVESSETLEQCRDEIALDLLHGSDAGPMVSVSAVREWLENGPSVRIGSDSRAALQQLIDAAEDIQPTPEGVAERETAE